jgi:hypothetical protein
MNIFKVRDINLQIEDILLENSNEETGEISESALEKIQELELEKNILIHDVAIAKIKYEQDSKLVDAEIKRLQSLKKERLNKSEFLKKLLRSMIPQGEKIKFDSLEINWRKSKVVESNENLNLMELSRSNPDLVRIKYELDKTACKKSKALPQSIEIVEKLNMVVK